MEKDFSGAPINVQQTKAPLKFIIEGKKYETRNQYMTGSELKQLADIPLDTDLFLSISKPYEDELIENNKTVNLARPETEYFFVKRKLQFTINSVPFVWYKQYIRGIQIRELGNIPREDELYLDLPDGWEDDFIEDNEIVDLARPGVERFISKEKPLRFMLYVNGREKEWQKRKITYEEVVKFAFPNVFLETSAFTVEYSGGPKQNPKGTMSKGDVVFITNKMNFNVDETGRS
ncbi:MAG: multiubiquitin domain-containing protein [Dysgonamonadaceae bacterium]|jgi:hypothetical protein|nr:multiubiquitin domain-containing protein [Dysgonamonadaceae bacterium]